jgi:hypothetical protein
MNFSGVRVADSASLASPAEYEDWKKINL